MPFDLSLDLVPRWSNAVQAATGGRSLNDSADPTTKANASVRALGRWMSTAALAFDVAGTLNNLFDDVTGAENASGDTEYRCFFIDNVGTDTAPALRAWIVAEVSGGAGIEIACNPLEASIRTFIGTGSPPSWQTSSAQDAGGALSENQAPRLFNGTLAGYNFVKPLTSLSALALGNLPAGWCVPVWVKRTMPAGVPGINDDGCTLQLKVGPEE